MKKYYIQYKPFLLFLGKFLLTYLLLTFIYESYLNQFDAAKFEVDGFTQLVAKQSKEVLVFFNSNASITANASEPGINIFFRQQFMAKIIEGCNGLSVIILFVSFVVAFTGKWKHTILFCIGGSLLIHIFNVARIALLCVLMYYFPKQQHILHSVIFPLFIYGVVFILWVIWVNQFSSYATKTTKK